MGSWFTKGYRPTGSIELWLVLPLFALVAWGAGLLGLLLLQAADTERTAWIYAISRSHGLDYSGAEALSRELGPKASTETEIEEADPAPFDLLKWASDLSAEIPLPFKGFLMVNPVQRSTIESVQRPDRSFLGSFSSKEDLRRKVVTAVPGDSFRKKEWLKQFLWAETMLESSFEYPFLQLLGVPELTRVIASGLGAGKLGAEGMDLLSRATRDLLRSQIDELKAASQNIEIDRWMPAVAEGLRHGDMTSLLDF